MRATNNGKDRLVEGRWVLLTDPEDERFAGPLVVSAVSRLDDMLTAVHVYDPESVYTDVNGNQNPLVSTVVILDSFDTIVVV